jgi:hypothetical protein
LYNKNITGILDIAIEGIIQSFLGRELPQLTVSKFKDPRTKEVQKEDQMKRQKLFETVFGQEIGAAKAHDERVSVETKRTRLEVSCQACSRHAGGGERFMRCKKCWDAIRRDVPYCSKCVQLPSSSTLSLLTLNIL